MPIFTAEELTFISIFDKPQRTELIEDILQVLPHIKGCETGILAQQVLEKLQHITDAEFADSIPPALQSV